MAQILYVTNILIDFGALAQERLPLNGLDNTAEMA